MIIFVYPPTIAVHLDKQEVDNALIWNAVYRAEHAGHKVNREILLRSALRYTSGGKIEVTLPLLEIAPIPDLIPLGKPEL